MKVAVAFDHRGVKLRERILADLAALVHQAVDLGTDKPEPRTDYPDKALQPGSHKVLWNGRTWTGALAFTGAYQVRVVAANAIGKVALLALFVARRS